MAQSKQRRTSQTERAREGITHITVCGFKSINEEQSIEVRPLTILAGANSSGKSSIMQPLLLLKQTLETSFDPGALLLNGPNVKFTSLDQLLSRTNNKKAVDRFHIGIGSKSRESLTTYFKQSENQGFDVEQMLYESPKEKYHLYVGMTKEEILALLNAFWKARLDEDMAAAMNNLYSSSRVVLIRNRCFLTLATKVGDNSAPIPSMEFEAAMEKYIRQTIHLPGLRGNPARNYPVTAVSTIFPGTFENYVASVIRQWQTEGNDEKLEVVNRDLARLGLTSKVVARAIDDTQVELRVSRQFRGHQGYAEDMVSVADVGLGISQTLPVVVALQVANEGQLIYLEQPEIHLHPRAQVAMAEVLADAAKQGKRLVVETHSSLLLRGIQTLVAEGKLPPELVKLHWFTLGADGSTQITSADLDETGAFGDWPEDFDTVTLDAESRYLDAAQARLEGK